MPIVIDRKTMKVLSEPQLTREQKDFAWEVLVREWCRKNPDALLELLQEVSDKSEEK